MFKSINGWTTVFWDPTSQLRTANSSLALHPFSLQLKLEKSKLLNREI
jgi:hypothetical protein